MSGELNQLNNMAHSSLSPKMDNSHQIDAHKMIKLLRGVNKEIEQLKADKQELVVLVGKLADVVDEYVENIGGCDHSVGICCCNEISLLEKADKLTKHKEQEDA